MKVGEISIEQVLDKTLRLHPDKVFPAPFDRMESHREFLDADGLLQLDFGAFLVRSEDRNILVDLGYGDGQLLENLVAGGLGPDRITDVVFTHLHHDHIGWAAHGDIVTFENATYHCDTRDWDYFVGPEAAFTGHGEWDRSPQQIKDAMTTIEGRVELWDSDTTIAPGVSIRRTPGHTPGSSIVVLSSGADRALLLGDTCHCPAELLEDDWAALVDVDPEMAQSVRDALARELEGTDAMVTAAHFPGMQFGRVVAGQGRRDWVFDLGT
ncbi:MBL fold metallo-hydrolase [Rhodococcus sp. NPDC003322]